MNHVHVLLVRGSPFHADRPERRMAEQCIWGLGFETRPRQIEIQKLLFD
jgi:hypothetical protein